MAKRTKQYGNGFIMAYDVKLGMEKTVAARKEIAKREVTRNPVANILASITDTFQRNRVRTHFLNGLIDVQDIKDGVYQ